MVAVAAKQVGQREEAALRAVQFQHGLRGGGQKTRDHRFQPAHRAGAGGVGAREGPRFPRQRVQLRPACRDGPWLSARAGWGSAGPAARRSGPPSRARWRSSGPPASWGTSPQTSARRASGRRRRTRCTAN
ncbi:hypothetical protein G6F40_016729 [Rhizopus arrhizus]|nr:hypothetical protein G6F40_016729 [Rhizopus arrhizus]